MKYLGQLLVLTFFLSMAQANSSEHHNSFLKTPWKMSASIQAQSFQNTLKKLSELDIDIAGVDIKKNKIDVLISDEEYSLLSEHGFELAVTEVRGVSKAPDEEYQNPAKVEAFLKEYHARFPELTSLVSIGKSIEGRDIWALKISDNAHITELEEPALLFNSMHHAREVMTPEVGLDIIEYLLENYNTDAEVTRWVNLSEIWVMPMFNVDGNMKMWSEDSWWRKNVRGGYGVDLNRNYPTGWKSCSGSSGWKWSQTYRGPSPASEPETQAMMKFIENTRPVFDISYHAYSELVIYPYGCEPQKTQTKEVVEKIGKEIASLLNYTPGTAWETLYNADGGDIDWMYEAYQVIPYVIEVNSSSEGFHPDFKKHRDPTVKRNRKGWQHLLNRALESGVRGVLSINGVLANDFKVNVYKVSGKGTKLFQNYVGHKSGAFHIVLNPGVYELRFLVDNKVSKVENIVVEDKLVRLNVNLD